MGNLIANPKIRVIFPSYPDLLYVVYRFLLSIITTLIRKKWWNYIQSSVNLGLDPMGHFILFYKCIPKNKDEILHNIFGTENLVNMFRKISKDNFLEVLLSTCSTFNSLIHVVFPKFPVCLMSQKSRSCLFFDS